MLIIISQPSAVRSVFERVVIIELSLHTILQIINVTIVGKKLILQVFTGYDYTELKNAETNKLNLLVFLAGQHSGA